MRKAVRFTWLSVVLLLLLLSGFAWGQSVPASDSDQITSPTDSAPLDVTVEVPLFPSAKDMEASEQFAVLSSASDPLIPQPGPGNSVLPLFHKPFAGDFPVTNFFDHNLPFIFEDTNGFLLTWWGERTRGVDGHPGYDWLMPEGTLLLAVADGEVTFAGTEQPFFCPTLGKTVSGQNVQIRHGT